MLLMTTPPLETEMIISFYEHSLSFVQVTQTAATFTGVYQFFRSEAQFQFTGVRAALSTGLFR